MFSQDKIKNARSKNLFELLSQRGYSLIQEGGQYRVAGFSGLIIKDSIWYHHSQNKGGNAIDLLMYLENLTFAKAVNTIDKDSNYYSCFAFDTDFHVAEDYLIRQRYIDYSLVYDLMATNLIKQAHENKVCFLGYENQSDLINAGPIKCISWRSTIDNKRGEISGSEKLYSFSIPDYDQEEKERHIILAEGPIDILSIACLENRKHNNGYYQTYKIALCGTNHFKIAERIKKLKPNRISLALDNDPAGQLAAKKFYQELSKTYPTKIINYPQKDPNALLTSLFISKK
jgi:hypothetical protein